ncbi:unnamed protein product [Pieris brassicae]|uniref:Uncharacterized protein n=1 Tax=Pieris brassicae TaxID=7116 RepID=A0A9P0TR77_PIEBR|nr:unnamed protein product [Pieris brassicae]
MTEVFLVGGWGLAEGVKLYLLLTNTYCFGEGYHSKRDIGKLQRKKEHREKLNFSPDTEQVLLKNDSAKKANKLDKENCF